MSQPKARAHEVFNKFLQYIINILIVYIIVVLIIGLGKTLFTVQTLISWDPISGSFARVVTEILTFLVIIELFRSFIGYFKEKRIRLNNMMDPTIILVIRELIVRLYTQEDVSWEALSGFSVLILSLGIVRTLAVSYSPKESLE